jgi:P-aminobenzoate N-oxygenase AurF
MKPWLSPDHINRLAADPAQCMRADLPLPVDSSLAFVPEDYTQLYFTPIYAALHREHRLRYNQLFALRINEYIMMLEADLVERLLTPLRRLPKIAADAALLAAIDTMIAEEHRHYGSFAALNRACRPDIYTPNRDRHFSRLPLWTKAMFWGAGILASRLAFSLWYLMAMEESSMALARDMARRPETETLGRLDPAFVSVHQEHMKDEARHLHIDGILIELCIAPVPRARRFLNAKLFRSLLAGVTRPSRGGSGVKVIRQLVRDMPELGWMEKDMINAVLDLKDNKKFQESLFNRNIMPMTFGVFDKTEELSGLSARMVGYDRR